jgi:predicted ATPase
MSTLNYNNNIINEVSSSMSLLKTAVIALSLSTAMMAVSPSVMAKEKKGGKIQNQSGEQVLVAFDDSIAAIEAASDALNSGAEKKEVLALMKKAKQTMNAIESATVNRAKQEANKHLRYSRKALKDNDMGEAAEQMALAVASVKNLKQIYLNF